MRATQEMWAFTSKRAAVLFTAASSTPHPLPFAARNDSAFVLGYRVPGVKENSADLLEVEPVKGRVRISLLA